VKTAPIDNGGLTGQSILQSVFLPTGRPRTVRATFIAYGSHQILRVQISQE